MLKSKVAWTIIAAGCACCAFPQDSNIAIDQSQGMKPIAASDLIRQIPVIGSLGVPLWQKCTIEGTWRSPRGAKESRPVFQAINVDGRTLDPPVEFDVVEPVWKSGRRRAQVSGMQWDWAASATGDDPPPQPIEGHKWRVVAIETGHVAGVPDDVMQEIGHIALLKAGFVTELQFLRVHDETHE